MSGKTSRILHQFPLIKTRSSQKARSELVEKTRALRRRGWRDWNLNRIVRTWRDIYKVDGAAVDPKRRTTEVLSVGGVELDGQPVWKWNQWNSGRWYGTRKDHPNYIDAGFYEIVQRSFRATYCHRAQNHTWKLDKWVLKMVSFCKSGQTYRHQGLKRRNPRHNSRQRTFWCLGHVIWGCKNMLEFFKEDQVALHCYWWGS